MKRFLTLGPGDIILAQLTCPMNDVIFLANNWITNPSPYKIEMVQFSIPVKLKFTFTAKNSTIIRIGKVQILKTQHFFMDWFNNFYFQFIISLVSNNQTQLRCQISTLGWYSQSWQNPKVTACLYVTQTLTNRGSSEKLSSTNFYVKNNDNLKDMFLF